MPAGDSVVVAVRQRGSGLTSGAVIRIESIYERDDALAAVGLAS